MPPRTRSAAGLIHSDDSESMRDLDDDAHPAPRMVWTIPTKEARRLPGVPEIVYTIPKELYLKAQNQQNQLTEAERQLLLSRGDLIGKALAQPTSLTEAERYKVMGRPPPDVVRARIEVASNGELSTVAELVAKATPDAKGLNDAELDLMANIFHEEHFHVRFMRGDVDQTPGADQAWLVWSFCEELGFVDEEKVIRMARMEQFIRGSDRSHAAFLAAMDAKEAAKIAAANTPEAMQRKEKERALNKEIKDFRHEQRIIGGEVGDLMLKLELESDLGDLEKNELRRQIKGKKAQSHTLYLKVQECRDRIYKLGPPNPHKDLEDAFALKQQAILDRLVELDKQLEGLQGQGDGSEKDEFKSKIEESYAEWAAITHDHKIAKAGLYGKVASDVPPFREDELQKEQISLKQMVIGARMTELREILGEMGEDDTGKNELWQQIEDKWAQSITLREKWREVGTLRYRSLGLDYEVSPEPHERGPYEELFIEEQKKKAQEENPGLSEQGVEKLLEDRWQAMKLRAREPYTRQHYINMLKKSRGWEAEAVSSLGEI